MDNDPFAALAHMYNDPRSQMHGKILIELTRKTETRETASDLPDLGHDAYWFAKEIRKLVWTSKAGDEVVMADHYDVTAVRVSTEAE